MIHSTQNRSIRRRFPKPISGLGRKKTKPNTTKASIRQSKEMYYNTLGMIGVGSPEGARGRNCRPPIPRRRSGPLCNSALHPSRVAESSTSFGWGKGGNVTSALPLQVTLCDPIWLVSSRSGVATLRTAIHLLHTYLSIRLRTIGRHRGLWRTKRRGTAKK